VTLPDRMRCVLVVDDDGAICDLVKECLDPEGYDVYCATDSDAAREIAARVGPGLAVVDVVLPGGASGLELAEELRAAGTRVVLMSGYPEVSADPKRLGHPFLGKPFKLRQLVETLGVVVE
jgi:DNA-binding response OmpR family regulator